MWSSLIALATKLLVLLYGFTHNYGVAIILLTILIRLILYPLMQKQMVSMREMQKIQPLMKAVQDKYKNNKERLNKELMALYKEHKVNPMSGCLPLLIQMPILILLFQTLRVFEYLDPITNNVAGGFLWIAKYYNVIEGGETIARAGLALSERLITLPGNGIFGLQSVGILPFLVGGSMYVQQKMTSTEGTTGKDGGSAQQTQKMMTIMMPLMIGFMSFSLPSGLTLYWFTSTLLGIGQQYLINKKMPTMDEIPKEELLEKGESKQKQLNKKPKEVLALASKEEPWIPGYEGASGKNSSGHMKTKKYKKDKKR